MRDVAARTDARTGALVSREGSALPLRVGHSPASKGNRRRSPDLRSGRAAITSSESVNGSVSRSVIETGDYRSRFHPRG